MSRSLKKGPFIDPKLEAKIYIEHAAVMGMTFHYTEEGR